MKRSRNQRRKLISNTRPTGFHKPRTLLTSRAARVLISNHHLLQKQLRSAIAKNDVSTIASLEAQLHRSGGLAEYQRASIQGQSHERGGDSSKVLMEWLSQDHVIPQIPEEGFSKLHMLEVGALNVNNACSRSRLFDVTRIDLHSQHSGIEVQDFMERPLLPTEQLMTEGFDVVSLSLVVNYVGDAAGRGRMLRRVSSFLRSKPSALETHDKVFPSLFLVLPAACVTNSRYLDETLLEAMMFSLGFTRSKRKMSPRLVYYLWRYDATLQETSQEFKRRVVRSGGDRNNFTITLV